MLGIFLIVFYFIFYNIDNTTAFSKIYLQIRDSYKDDEYHGNVRGSIGSLNSRTYNDIELISKALEIVKQEKSGINTVEISKCLSIGVGNTKNKFNCIKKLLYKGKTNKNKKPYFYMKVYNKESQPNKFKHKNNRFVDLTKSDYDVERSFRTFFDFSNDYLDIHDLLRRKNEVNEDKSVKTEKIINNVFEFMPDKNGNNYLRTLTNLSTDHLDTDDLKTDTKMANNNNVFNLKRTKNKVNLRNLKFSQDYFDAKDLLRTNPKKADETPKEKENNEKKKKLYVYKLIPTTKDLRRFRNTAQNQFSKKILRTASFESESSVSSDESVSKDEVEASREEYERKIENVKDKKPKRFHVIDKSVNEESSKEDTSNESEIPIQRPIEISKESKKVYYMQGSNRIYKDKNGRRRLPHFLPKRYHWNEEDMKNLKNYWFDGPQGKYWGAHKTPY